MPYSINEAACFKLPTQCKQECCAATSKAREVGPYLTLCMCGLSATSQKHEERLEMLVQSRKGQHLQRPLRSSPERTKRLAWQKHQYLRCHVCISTHTSSC